MVDVFEAFIEFMQSYPRTRYTITNTYEGEVRVAATTSITAYIHPDDYEKEVYNAQGQRIEERVKIFTFLDADISVNDEVEYVSRTYKVIADNTKQVGGYKKLLAELVA